MATPTAVDLVFDWRELTLAGTLHVPTHGAQHSVVLMLQGSGPADRDCGDYVPPIRQAFIERGIAAFSFDKPGCGASSGDWRHHGLEGRADQATAALDVLSSHPAIDPARVGVWGQSQGGWLVQMLASRVRSLSFAIANSGPSIGVLQQNLYGCEHTMRSHGFDEPSIRQALAFLEDVHRAAEAAVDYGTLIEELVEPVRSEPWYGSYLTIEDALDWELMKVFAREGYDPMAALAHVECPFLAVYGGLDVLLPAWRGAEESGTALHAAGNPDSTVVVFPSGDHRIQDPGTGRFVDGYLDLIGDWTARRVQ